MGALKPTDSYGLAPFLMGGGGFQKRTSCRQIAREQAGTFEATIARCL
jgi:hypothetical protein